MCSDLVVLIDDDLDIPTGLLAERLGDSRLTIRHSKAEDASAGCETDDPPLVTIIGSGAANPLQTARLIHARCPMSHLILVAEGDALATLRRQLQLAAMIGNYWSLSSRRPEDILSVVVDAIRSSRQRKRTRTQIRAINTKATLPTNLDPAKVGQLVISDRFLASILVHASDAIISTDLAGNIQTWNAAAETLLGFTEKEMFHASIGQVQAPDDPEVLLAPLAEAVRSNARVRRDLTTSTKAGGVVDLDVTLSPVADEAGVPYGVAIIARDITERKRAQAEVQEARDYLNLMLASATDYAIISMAPGGEVVKWSPGAERIFGYSEAEVLGRSADFIFTPEDRDAGVSRFEMDTALSTGKSVDERWHVRKNGDRFYASGMVSAMYDERGTLKGLVKIARDMSRQKQAEEELIAARNAAEAANIAKTEFLANMSHEIRTPMNAIIGLSNIIGMSKPLTPRQAEYVNTLLISANGLLSLINDLLDVSKIEANSVALEHVPFNLTQIVQEVSSMMGVRVREKGLSFTSRGECIVGRTFLGDPTRIRQIILNLCSNAIKFTDQGRVHVSIECHPTSDAGRETICISVTDTGIGIDPAKVETIFDKFVQADASMTRRYGGTGLGLAITKTLTEIMGGTISVKSEPGRGSTFEVCLPLTLATPEDNKTTNLHLPEVLHSEEANGLNVLLVEDHEPNVLVATTYLGGFGYHVDVARNGLEAFEMVKHRSYAAILMDVQMPGLNGFEATRLIRQHESQNGRVRVPIIGMTAHALQGDRERCLAAGMDEYLSKPFDPVNLLAKMSLVVRGSDDDPLQ